MTEIKTIRQNFLAIKQKIEAAAREADRTADAVKIVVASKYSTSVEELLALSDIGVEAFGENRLQSLEDKYYQTQELGKNLNWHFIGHLQSNKVKKAVSIVELIQSVDSLKIASIIDQSARDIGKKQKILLQLKVSKEVSKTGFSDEDIISVCKDITQLKNIQVQGIMTIPPMVDRGELAKLFKFASGTLSKLQSLYNIGDTLSMGMSGDYELAIKEGANMVRIGSAIWR